MRQPIDFQLTKPLGPLPNRTAFSTDPPDFRKYTSGFIFLTPLLLAFLPQKTDGSVGF